MTIKLNPQIPMATMPKKNPYKNKTILLFKNHAIDDEKINEMHHLINKGEIIQRGVCYLELVSWESTVSGEIT